MKGTTFIVVLLTGLLAACVSSQVARPAGRSGCPKGLLGNRYQDWPLYMALRFVADGKLLEPAGPIASRELNDSLINRPLRFGSLYFIPTDRLRFKTYGWVRCVRGQDTMHVLVEPPPHRDWLLDSIAFHPGFYKLLPLPATNQSFRNCDSASFATYYQQHEAALARANPFAGYCFYKRLPPPYLAPRKPDDITPLVPTDIFAFLVSRKTYCRLTHAYKLEPFPLGTSRAEFAELGAFR